MKVEGEAPLAPLEFDINSPSLLAQPTRRIDRRIICDVHADHPSRRIGLEPRFFHGAYKFTGDCWLLSCREGMCFEPSVSGRKPPMAVPDESKVVQPLV